MSSVDVIVVMVTQDLMGNAWIRAGGRSFSWFNVAREFMPIQMITFVKQGNGKGCTPLTKIYNLNYLNISF